MTTTYYPQGTEERRSGRGEPRQGAARQVYVRDLAAGDEERLRAMFRRLSRETIYQRFHMPYPLVPEVLAVHLTRHTGGRSVVAVAGDEIVGHAVYVEEAPGEAEMAIVIEDRWQSRGIGKELLAGLARQATGRGVASFTAVTLAENRRVLNLVDAVFAGVRYAARGNTYDVRIPLDGLRPAFAGDLRPAA